MRDLLIKRAALIRHCRAFMEQRQVLEADTPTLWPSTIPDPNIESFRLGSPRFFDGTNRDWFLQTSPEFSLKRLIAESGLDLYELKHVFRNEALGRNHHPEFLMLEWYRTGFDDKKLMHEVAELLTILLPDHVAPYPVKTLTYHQAFAQFLDIDIDTVSLESLAHIALSQCHYQEPQSNRHTLLDLLMGMLIGPQLGQQGLCFITDYPIEQAALARPQTHNPTVAARFEAYVSGIELANGFYELTDPLVQRQRFEADQQTRQERGQLPVPIDEEFLASLNKLPECAGVAMGLDRVLLLQLKQDHLKHIIPLSFYPFE